MERTTGFLNTKLSSKSKIHKIQNTDGEEDSLPKTKSSSKSKIHSKTGLVDTKSSKFKIQDTFERSSALKTIMKNIIVTLFIL